MTISRRELLAAAGAAVVCGQMPAAASSAFKIVPEKGAKLRVLRWKRFVQGEEDAWLANTAKFTQATGIEVHVDNERWEDIRSMAAFSARADSGHDVILGWFDDPHLYPDSLVDLTDLANHLGRVNGGWYPVCQRYGMHQGRWIALPIGVIGQVLVYRKSQVQAAGFERFPTDLGGLLRLCRSLKTKGTPAGLTLGNAVGDSTWTSWLVWSHGGKLVDDDNRVCINSPQTVAALEYGKELYETFIPGTLKWLDPTNNKTFLAGEISLTYNSVSIYSAAKDDRQLKELARDIYHAALPIGPVKKPTEFNLFSQAMVLKHTPYPNAAKEYLRFMMEKEQYNHWLQSSQGYITQTMRAFEKSPVWTGDPKLAVFKNATRSMLSNGYSGSLGPASAAVMADFIIVNMVADAVTGARSPKAAAERAEARARAHYKS